MNSYIKIILFIFVLSNLLYGCHSTEKEKKEIHHEEDHSSHSPIIQLTSQQKEAIGIQLDTISNRPFHHSIQISGRLANLPQYEAQVSTFIGGTIKEIKVKEGDKVHKGQILATLQDPVYIELQQNFQEISGELGFLQKEYERKETLFKKGVSSAKAYQKAKAAYLKAKAQSNGLKRKLQLLGISSEAVTKGQMFSEISLRAPIDGFITTINISTGQFSSPEKGLFEISNNAHVFADFKVFDQDINRVKEGDIIYFTVSNAPEEVLKAKVFSIGKALDNSKQAVHVHAKILSKPSHLLPGMVINGRIALDQEKAIALPTEAIIKEGSQSFIFIKDTSYSQNNKTRFKRTEIVSKKTDQGYTEIKLLHPLPRTTLVVTKGAYYLQSDLAKEGYKHEH